MATAAVLNATASIINGQGLNTNPNVLAEISAYQSQVPIHTLQTIFSTATSNATIANVLLPILNTIGANVTHGQFLLDIYPPNITPVTSTNVNISYYGNALASVSGTIKNQALAPFVNGMSGFANTFSYIQGYASSMFDIASSVYMLANVTYAESGLSYTNPVHLATGGIGDEASILASIVSGWGTMYDVTNINLISDPYVFGENLLKQGLGQYGNLSANLSATGLNTSKLTSIPPTVTTTQQQRSTLTTASPVGSVLMPVVNNIQTTNTVSGTSETVILNVYKNVTGANLQTIVSTTGFDQVNIQAQTLADYLNLELIVPPNLIPVLANLNIVTFTDLGNYISSKISNKTFKNWLGVADFLSGIEVPTLNYTSANASTTVISPTTITTLTALTGTGTGPFNNPVVVDFIGACAGIPYTANLQTINTNYNSVVGNVSSAIINLGVAVYNYRANALVNIANVSTSSVSTAVTAVNTALNSLPTNAIINECSTAYYTMINRLTTEVSNLTSAGVIFSPASNTGLLNFGQSIGVLGGTDKTGIASNVAIVNLITNDFPGDTIKVAIAENNNGTIATNNPNPRQVLNTSNQQNIPLSTYLSQNK